MLRIQFHTTHTGDCVFIDTGSQLFLVDCGEGPNYQRIIRELDYDTIVGIVLSHAHADHWAALPEVMRLLAPDAWLAKSGATFTNELMRKQKPYHKVTQPIDYSGAIDAYIELPTSPVPAIHMDGIWLSDLNASNSGQKIETDRCDHSLIHHGCIVPLIETPSMTVLLGTDLEAPVWDELYEQGKLPRNISVLLAPNHGQKQGRIIERVFNHLNPSCVIISDADPDENDNLAHWSQFGRRVITLKEVGCVTINETGFMETE